LVALRTSGKTYKQKFKNNYKGITHPNSFPAKITMSDSEVHVKAAIVFDRSEYNVRYGSGSFFDDLGDKIIYDDIEIGIELVASKKEV